MKLNLGSGKSRFPNYKNVDIDPAVEPDYIANLVEKLPFEANSIEEVLLIHTIEHIQKQYHQNIYDEIYRILSTDGRLILAYPEFEMVAKNWLEDKAGMREFWGWAIYGRQLSPSDFHVSLMYTPEVIDLLKSSGFKDFEISQEPTQNFNTVVKCIKGIPLKTYEDSVGEYFFAKVGN